VRHELKTWPMYFDAIVSGQKTFEMRKADRDFTIGDTLWLRDWSPVAGYSGREIEVDVTYVLQDAEHFGLMKGFVCMGIAFPEHHYDDCRRIPQ
jgi:hypothetical protein